MQYATAYHKEDTADPYWVINSDTNQPVGKHPTPKLQRDHLRALYANVPEATKEVNMPNTLSDEYKATADINDLPDSAFLHVEAGGEKDDTGKTVPRTLRHLPYKTASGAIDLPKLRSALSRLGQSNTGNTGGDKWLTESLRKSLQAKAEKILQDNTDATSAESKEQGGVIDRVLSFLRGEKEGRRNSNTDAGRLQQIHDLAVENGAQCPLVMKQANGSYRWILLSTNSYQDRDGEIVSQKAQEADVERMNQTRNFGPLRLWHLGYPDVAQKEAGPGVDIGDCDFSQMFGRIRVESGTFRNNRVAAAIKGHADQWLSSIGFFHPLDQPDRDGVYQDSFTFERSLLPRHYASNPLTPLAAIMKENDNMKQEEKIKQLSDLLGDAALADQVLKQAEATEKAAQERGLRYKAADMPPAKQGTEGSEQEEETEPKAEAVAEGDAPDYEAMAKGLAPFIMKMIEEKMAGTAKEYTEKSASLVAQMTALDSALKETRQIVDVLNADVPKGVKRHLASEAKETIAPEGKYKNLEAPAPDPLGTIFNWLAQPAQGMPPVVQSTSDK